MTEPPSGDPTPGVRLATVLPFRQRSTEPEEPPERFDLSTSDGMVILTVVSGGRTVLTWEMSPQGAREYAHLLLQWAHHVERLTFHNDPRSPLLKHLDQRGMLPALDALAKRRWLKVEAILAPTSAPAMTARDELWAMLLDLHPDRSTRPAWGCSGTEVGEWFGVSSSTVWRRARAWVAAYEAEEGT